MTRHALGCTLLLLALTGPAVAASKSFDLTVSAGDRDRANLPVKATVLVPAAMDKARSVVLEGGDGKPPTAQLTMPGLLSPNLTTDGSLPREVHFILPELKAGQTLKLKATVSDEEPSKGGFRWQDKPGDFAELFLGDKPVARYMYTTFDDSSKEQRFLTYKVFHHLYDPDGQRLVTQGAKPGNQFPHHRGVFFAFNKITYGEGKKADVWHCTGDAYQSHEKFLAAEAGPVLARHRLEIAWHGEKKEIFAVEDRELTFYNTPGGRLVEFATRVRTTGGPIKLDGDPQHAGFQFRAHEDVSSKTKKDTYYVRPDGRGKPGETRNWDPNKNKMVGVNLPWNALSIVLDGQRYTVGYLDRPENPKESRSSERDYGRFGSYFVYDITGQKPLELNYRLWLQKGEMDVKDMEAQSANFTQPAFVKVQ